ncbi:hypothetical protein TRFO_41298 [Tritrichomonas foetus]|uniref:UBA domain-containing protein n=1 Tax=Tritrichomonas foetus TaxID=1144522 RepID=A0A1J4L1Y7_9EUKA|nr:hypothetical protein TRFO_41298 [Tritrichomonas foetus]|eukprot:OHT17088.1 hypothetical protein TRFO_41298 [Tritrichomonas foetus]
MSQVKFLTVSGKAFNLKIKPDDSIAKIQRMIRKRRKVSGKFQLIYDDNILSDSKLLFKDIHYDINSFIIVHLPVNTTSFPTFFAFFAQEDVLAEEEEFLEEEMTYEDPPNIDEMITNLAEMGFPSEQCRTALRMTKYNTNDAINKLLSGNVPIQEDSSDSEDAEEEIRILKLEEILFSFSDQEKKVVENLQIETGRDLNDVVMIYNGCRKDINSARMFLNTYS